MEGKETSTVLREGSAGYKEKEDQTFLGLRLQVRAFPVWCTSDYHVLTLLVVSSSNLSGLSSHHKVVIEDFLRDYFV